MIKMKSKHFNTWIYTMYVIVMILILTIFVYRVHTRSQVTDMSVGQIIQISNNYEFGEVYDRQGNLIVWGEGKKIKWCDKETEMAYATILGENYEEILGSRVTVLGNCPWVFGTEDNQFTVSSLFNPMTEKKGGSVYITLDSELQKYITDILSDYENAYCVVSNYKTGELLGIKGNVFSTTLHPGSTIKPILAATALSIDKNILGYIYNCTDANHNFMTENGLVRINCVNQISHGKMDMNSAITYSCNGYFISLMQEVGKKKMCKELEKWGFDTIVAYDQFQYWDHSFLKYSDNETDYLLGGIGQANTFITPAGLNFCTNALLHKGKLSEPIWYMKKKGSERAEWIDINNNAEMKFCEEEAANTVVQMMENVTKNGTGKEFYLPGFAAKTGTAQKVDESGTLTGKYTVWTTGGLLNEKTPYSVTVCLDNVTSETRSADAGLIARDILHFMMKGDE